MNPNQAKIVNRLVSKTKCLKNKLTGHHGHKEFQNEGPDTSGIFISSKTSKLSAVKNFLKPSYKPLSA